MLNIVTAREERLLIIEIDEVRVPVGVVLISKERGIGSHADHIAILFYVHQIERLCESVAPLIAMCLLLSGVFSEIYLGLAVARIAVVLTFLKEIVARLIVMLVDYRHIELFCELPGIVIIRISWVRAWTCCAYDSDFRMLLGDNLIHILESLGKLRSDFLLITDAKILQTERLWMTSLSAYLAPFGGGIAVSPLYQIESILHPFVHFRHWNDLLRLSFHSPAAIDTLTTYSAWEDRHWLHIEVFTELEVFIIAQTHGLAVAPSVFECFSLLFRAYSSLPAVCIPESITAAMHYASAWKAHEFRVESLQRLNEILAKSVSFEGILRHKRDHIHIKLTSFEDQNLETCIRTSLRSR